MGKAVGSGESFSLIQISHGAATSSSGPNLRLAHREKISKLFQRCHFESFLAHREGGTNGPRAHSVKNGANLPRGSASSRPTVRPAARLCDKLYTTTALNPSTTLLEFYESIETPGSAGSRGVNRRSPTRLKLRRFGQSGPLALDK